MNTNSFKLNEGAHGQREAKTPKTSSCQDGGCFPATGNLLLGREANLTTNSTCGLDGPEK